MASMRKSDISVYPGGCLFLWLSRMKTSTTHGLSLFRSKESVFACPIHSLAVAMIMQVEPTEMLLSNIPATSYTEVPDTTSSASLVDLLDALEQQEPLSVQARASDGVRSRKKPGINSYVNRLLTKLATWCCEDNLPITPNLTSHSFRRGAAQHANANSDVSCQWILDRGGWKLCSINKGFTYICNTSKEDQKVAKALAGWRVDDVPSLPDLSVFDGVVRKKITRLRNVMFASACGLAGPTQNLNDDILR